MDRGSWFCGANRVAGAVCESRDNGRADRGWRARDPARNDNGPEQICAASLANARRLSRSEYKLASKAWCSRCKGASSRVKLIQKRLLFLRFRPLSGLQSSFSGLHLSQLQISNAFAVHEIHRSLLSVSVAGPCRGKLLRETRKENGVFACQLAANT